MIVAASEGSREGGLGLGAGTQTCLEEASLTASFRVEGRHQSTWQN